MGTDKDLCIQASLTGGGYEHPYDLGYCGNLHAIFGGNPSLWFLPDKAAGDGDGTCFPTSWDHKSFGL